MNHWFWLWHHFLHWSGIDNVSGPWYGFWSGFGSCFVGLTLLGGMAHVIIAHVCHEPGCVRWGHHVTPKGYRLCKKHVGMPEIELNLHPVNHDHIYA
jgi:hypothetical protein